MVSQMGLVGPRIPGQVREGVRTLSGSVVRTARCEGCCIAETPQLTSRALPQAESKDFERCGNQICTSCSLNFLM